MGRDENEFSSCPECSKTTYSNKEKKCTGCGYTRQYEKCSRCSAELSVGEQNLGGLCSACANQWEKMKKE
jgi:hypothetical protein